VRYPLFESACCTKKKMALREQFLSKFFYGILLCRIEMHIAITAYDITSKLT